VVNKGERPNLSKAETNELKKELQGFAEDYRASVGRRTAELKKEKRR
jgi:hypothetical protein